MKIQKHLNAGKPNLSKIGHRASGIGHRASGIGNKSALLAALLVSALSLASWEQSQAQLFIHVYPSQNNPTNQTLWIFSGSSTANDASNIRVGAAIGNDRDTWEFGTPNNGDFFNANKPSDTNFQLSPLFSSTNTIDIDSVRARIPGGGRTNINFAASATNTPTITTGSGSRTISHFFMDDDTNNDKVGIRVSGTALNYSSGDTSAWVGAGILNKPIGDFFTGTYNNRSTSGYPGPRFAAQSNGSVRVVVNSQIIPEPQEYALVFGLFALGFVILHRHFQKKQRQQAAAS